MTDVVILGGHGKVALLLAPLLVARGDRVTVAAGQGAGHAGTEHPDPADAGGAAVRLRAHSPTTRTCSARDLPSRFFMRVK